MVISMQPKISIITAVYNGVNTIEQAISSVVNQTYQNIEYIIIDGGSNDGTVDIIRKYEDKITYWVSEPDDGIYDAFKKGLLVAKGEYIQFLGSDDCLVAEDTLEKTVKNLNENVDILSCCVYLVHESLCKQVLLSNSQAINKSEFKGDMIPHNGMFTRRSLFNIYPFDEKYKLRSDYKFFLQCYFDESVRFRFVDLPVVYYSASGTSSYNDLTDETLKIYKDLGVSFPLSVEEECWWKSIVRMILKRIGIFSMCLKVYWQFVFMRRSYKNQIITPHCCDNKICRWCGRH